MGMGGQRHAPDALSPRQTQYPLYMRPGGPQGRSGLMRKISPPPGFDPRTVQPIATFFSVAQQPKSGLDSFVLRAVDHTQSDTHTHMHTHAKEVELRRG